ncbi:hypothetical protein [Actinomadura sp. SCN-SB]|uniref:hypothetical protein n=1 Tax=Actinomadura sp. SCN-SB TaxID=3373092 RepID=UPI003750AF58
MGERLNLQPDGPHSDDYTETLARGFAEVVRVLNYATGSHASAGLTCPQTVYTLAGNLSGGSAGLDQLFRQMTTYLTEARGHVADTSGNAPAKVTDALERLAGARAAASALARDLSGLQSATSGLYLPDSDDMEP